MSDIHPRALRLDEVAVSVDQQLNSGPTDECMFIIRRLFQNSIQVDFARFKRKNIVLESG